MKIASKDYIINTVFRTNVLPIISECNTSCIFCSHKQNSPEVEVFRIPKLSLTDVEELLGFLSPNKKIIIGEAATRIIEGEPLLHKQFLDIVTIIRQRFKATPIQITTNGILLSEDLVDKLASLGNIELNISVNCVNEEKRTVILGTKNCANIREKISLLKDKLKFAGSMVYVPEIMDSNDIEEVISVLDEYGANSIRIFLPGIASRTKTTPGLFDMFTEMTEFVREMRLRYKVPIIIEPAFIEDLQCNVEGVMDNSPASEAGIRTDDIILEIDGEKVNSRVDAFNKAFEAKNPVLTITRDGQILDVKLNKHKNTPPGFIVLYDIDTDVATQVERVMERNYLKIESAANSNIAKRVWLLTSELAEKIINSLLSLKSLDYDYEVISVKNNHFGGTIMCAGLMTVQDVISTISEELTQKEKPDLIILPVIMFDFKKRDLLGRNMKEIEDRFGIPVDIV